MKQLAPYLFGILAALVIGESASVYITDLMGQATRLLGGQ